MAAKSSTITEDLILLRNSHENIKLRCTAERRPPLLLTVQCWRSHCWTAPHDPTGCFSFTTGWYQLILTACGARLRLRSRFSLPGQIGPPLYNDALIARDAGKLLSARGVEYGIEIRAAKRCSIAMRLPFPKTRR